MTTAVQCPYRFEDETQCQLPKGHVRGHLHDQAGILRDATFYCRLHGTRFPWSAGCPKCAEHGESEQARKAAEWTQVSPGETLLCWARTPLGHCTLPRDHEGGHQTPFAPGAEIYGGPEAPPEPGPQTPPQAVDDSVNPELALLRKILAQGEWVDENGEHNEWGAGYFHLDDDANYMVIDRSYELSEDEVSLVLRIRNGE